MPWLAWIHQVNRKSLEKDVLAGFTGSLIVLPQGIAYAAIAHLPPEFGLYCAIGPTIVAALFGSSWHMVSGPTAAISIVVFSALASLAQPGSAHYIVLALTLGFLVGTIQLAIGLARLGNLARYISHSVVVGFTSGAAFLIVASQLKNFLGYPGASATGFFSQIWQALILLSQGQWRIAAVGVLTLAVALTARRIQRGLPNTVLAMIAASLAGMWLGDVPTVNVLPAALPQLSIPSFDPTTWASLSASAAIIALLALTEAIAIARSVALRSGQTIDCNQEVIGQGLSNLAGSFLSGYPSSGSFTRSGLNYDAGARTPMAAVCSSIFLVGILAVLTDWIAHLPIAAMAGILFLVARGLIDRQEIRAIFAGPRQELLVFSLTFLSTLVVDVEYAVLIGIAASLLMRRMGFGAADGIGRGTD